ncbi:MAG TPA: hypothetical protein VFX86_02905 [Candidatus Saccharimonadales bacterium]|nr:hypothetical protein [Candidatus Saccharimonadales bacterium]
MNLLAIKWPVRSLLVFLQISVLVLAASTPFLNNPNASAAQLTSRSMTLSSAVPAASSVTHTFGFTVPTATTILGIKFQACSAAIGTCTAPTGLSYSSRVIGSPTGFTGTAFAVDTTGANDCTPGAAVICINRASGTDTSGAKTVPFTTITNPSTTNSTFFVRITTYNDDDYEAADSLDNGTVAAAVTQTLTISARIQEILNFCVGNTTVDDATTSPGATCAAVSGTTVDLGTLDASTVNTSPVGTGNDGNNTNGIAMLRTNASSGATVSYKSIQGSGSEHLGALRVSGATCNVGDVNTDQCVTSAGTTQSAFVAGTEEFGMTIGGINCGSTTAYTCTFASGTYNLQRDTQYDGLGSNTYGSDNSNGYAWDETGTLDQVASSSGAVDDEALILKFAATPNAVTPTGSYSTQADFIVVATY